MLINCFRKYKLFFFLIFNKVIIIKYCKLIFFCVYEIFVMFLMKNMYLLYRYNYNKSLFIVYGCYINYDLLGNVYFNVDISIR